MQLKNYFTLTLLLAFSSLSLTAQIFYTEDFSGGSMPASWTSVDLTSLADEACIFEYATDAPIYQDGFSEEFAGPTAANGFLIADSNVNNGQERTVDNTTQLTTHAIDCSGQNAVWLGFQSYLGVFSSVAETDAIIRVSTDGVNWTDFTAYPGFTETNVFSSNPHFVNIDISSVAANEASVFIQWQWVGTLDYHWIIDDITLSTEAEPLAANDMRINPFAAVAPNFATPVSQVEAFGFIADIENVGGEEQVDIDLVMSIVDGSGTEVFTDFVNYDMVAPDSLAENKFFDNEFTPPAVVDQYLATYSLDYTSTEDDFEPSNNELSFPFIVTEDLFSKENGGNFTVRPSDDVDFTWGNVFYVNSATNASGQQLYADEISFQVSNATPANVAGKTVNVFLYSWDGTLDPNGNDITQDLYTFAGVNSYTFVGDESGLITVDANDGDPIALEANTYYMPAVQYISGDGTTEFRLIGSDQTDYAAMNFYTDSLERSRYAAILDVGNEGTLGLLGFGYDFVPVIRLSITTLTATNEVELSAGSVAVFPNPAKERTTVDLDLEEVTSGTLQVLDIQGKVLQSHTLTNVQTHRMELVTKDLPSGQYTVRVQTELGVSTQKLVVQH